MKRDILDEIKVGGTVTSCLKKLYVFLTNIVWPLKKIISHEMKIRFE